MNTLVKTTTDQPRRGEDWNPYEILGLVPPASEKQIRAAYRRLARSMHLDNGGSEEAFRELAEAHDFLLDPVSRSLWERKQVRAKPEQRKMAQAGLRQLCDQVIEFIVGGGAPPEHANIPALMKKEVRARLDKLAVMKSDVSRQLGRHKLMLNTVTRKGGGENIVAQVLARRVEDLQVAIKQVADDMLIGEIMLAELEAYCSNVPDQPAPAPRRYDAWNDVVLCDVRFYTGGFS